MNKTNKILIGFGTVAAVAAPVITVVSCGDETPTATFWNYKDYISEDAQNSIKGYYDYTQFNDLPELERAILGNKVMAGVGSDYYNVMLANKGLIQKIDFNAVFKGVKVTVNGTEKTFGNLPAAEIEETVKSLYTKQVWDLMATFDDSVDTGDLWEYMVPYFLQNKVIAINPTKVTANAGHDAELATLKGVDQTAIDALFPDKSYSAILAKLKAIGFKDIAVNNYMRDNLMIGSEVTTFSNTVNADTAPTYIQGFDAVLDSLSSDESHRRFIDSGYETLMALHSRSEVEQFGSDVAIMYNGDALDAFYGQDQVPKVTNWDHAGEIRTITPTNTTYLLDGVVIPAYITGDNLTTVNEMINKSLYQNATLTDETIYNDGEIIDVNMAYNNFDFVNYTTPIQAIYEDIMGDGTAGTGYFCDTFVDAPGNKFGAAGDAPTDEELATAANNVEAYAKHIFEISGTIDANHITKPIDSDVQEVVEGLYNKAFINN